LDIVVTYGDEQRMLAVSYQLYRDSAAILEHWHLADPYIARVMEHCVVAEFQIHGERDMEVLARMRPMLDDGRATLIPRISGFVRLYSYHT